MTELKLRNNNSNPIKILYIAGAGRSGSTLLGDVLNAVDGMLHIGEFRGVFDYTTIPENVMPCSCGNSYDVCPFWGTIFREEYGDRWESIFDTLRIEDRLPRIATLPLLFVQKRLKFSQPSMDRLSVELCESMKIVQRIINTTGVDIIVDSSKSPSFAWLMSQQDNVEMIVVHLLRDPRATAFSWINRPIPIPDLEKGYAKIRNRPFKEAFNSWIKDNMGSRFLKVAGFPYLSIRYEDLVQDPEEVLSKIIDFCNENGFKVCLQKKLRAELQQGVVDFGERHLIGSNPRVKAISNKVILKNDNKWQSQIFNWQIVLWTIIFSPWLVWVGYPLWIKKPHD